MSIFQLSALVLTLAALFSYLNHRYLGLPTTIGIMGMAIVTSGGLVLAGAFGWSGIHKTAASLMESIDFSKALLHGMLSFLLFAGALNVNLKELAGQKWVITVLATVGLLLATGIVGGLSWLVFGWIGVDVPFLYCLLFGALISPTDPVAVMGILKKARAPEALKAQITGESLFNDGVGVVVFLVILSVIESGHDVSVVHVGRLFLEEAVGGAAFGLATGWITFLMLRSVDNYQVEVLLTLGLVMGGYALADALHISGPIAMVVAGLIVGGRGRQFGMSATTREHIDSFWELLDEIFNAVLFVLIGLEVLVLTVHVNYVIAGPAIIAVVLLARFASVSIPVVLMRPFQTFNPMAVRVLTWGGLRGGISVALALSVPTGPEREVLVAITYIVVVFSILVQGLSIGKMVSASTQRIEATVAQNMV